MQDEGRRSALRAALAISGACLVGAGRPLLAAPPVPSPSGQPAGPAIQRIAFGSCVHQRRPQPIWDDVLAARPDLFVFLGDNIYGDTRDLGVLEGEYAKLAAQPGFQRLRASTPVLATWDDHDYGENDAGAEFPMKEPFRQAFLRFWGEPEGSPRWARDGVYTSARFGPSGQRLQLILLDLRYNRTPISRQIAFPNDRVYERWVRRELAAGRAVPGPYARNPDLSATMLGERQWAWLHERLRQPADLRLIGSSLQVLADFTGWEAWANYPRDQARLFDAIRQTAARGVVFLSGDMHYGELSRLDANVPYPLWDLTSSGLTEVWTIPVPNALRVGEAQAVENFGLVEVDWSERRVRLSIRALGGAERLAHELSIDALAAAATPA